MGYKSSAILAMACLVGSGAVAAQDGSQIEPRADHVLREASNYLASLEHFTVEAVVAEDEWTDSGLLVELDSSVKLAVRRPDRMWAESHGAGGHRRYWYDGGMFTLMDYTAGTFARAAMPATIDGMLETMIQRYGVNTPLADLAFSDLYGAVAAKVTSGTYVGMTTIGGVEYHHLAFSQELVDWQLWVENGSKPLPARMVITYKGDEGMPRFSATLSAWDTASPLPDALFDFTAPPGAAEIEFVASGGDGR